MLVDRDLRFSLPTSTERALKVGGYYDLTQSPQLDLADVSTDDRVAFERAWSILSSQPQFRDQVISRTGDSLALRRGGVEAFISFIEAQARDSLDRLRANFPDIPTEDRFNLANFIALQSVRGDHFRVTINEIARLALGHITESDPRMRAKWRATFGGRDVFEALEGLTFGGDRLLSEMLEIAFRIIAPEVFTRRWRLLEFPPHSVLTSDEPVGLWARPGRDPDTEPLGIATADCVFFPIDDSRVLQLLRPDVNLQEARVVGSTTKLRQSNQVIAASARRWIVHHPESLAIEMVSPSPHPRAVRQVISAAHPDGSQTELVRFTRRPSASPLRHTRSKKPGTKR